MSPDAGRMLSSLCSGIETRVHAAPAGQCAHIHFLLQVTRSQQFPRSPGVGASSTLSSAVSAEMMGSPCLPTVGLPCWWRKMAPSLRFVVIRRELQVRPGPSPSRKWTWQKGGRTSLTHVQTLKCAERELTCPIGPALSQPRRQPPSPLLTPCLRSGYIYIPLLMGTL